jgi:hypothetical protein
MKRTTTRRLGLLLFFSQLCSQGVWLESWVEEELKNASSFRFLTGILPVAVGPSQNSPSQSLRYTNGAIPSGLANEKKTGK